MTDEGVTEQASLYSDRWAIEDTNRNLKQHLGVHNPQSWVGDGPERVVALAGWLYSAAWQWYVLVHAEQPTWPDRPWYPTKRTPSFAEALAALRGETWSAILGARAAVSTTQNFPPTSSPYWQTLLDQQAEFAKSTYRNVTSSSGTVSNPWGYAGGYTDSTGLVKFGARYYDPRVGRWTQQDPLLANLFAPSSLNCYVYANNCPVNATDPTGYVCWDTSDGRCFGTPSLPFSSHWRY